MIESIDSNGVFELIYPSNDEREILVDFLIKEYKLEDIEIKNNFEYGCDYVIRRIKVKKEYNNAIIKCLNIIKEYKSYKLITIKKKKSFFDYIFGLPKLSTYDLIEKTRDEKLKEFKKIKNDIKNTIIEELFKTFDYNFLKEEILKIEKI